MFYLDLFGPFRLTNSGGVEIKIDSQRAQCILAVLASSPGGKRPRSTLQNLFWGNRNREQAQASLRSELYNIRRSLGEESSELIISDMRHIILNLDKLECSLPLDEQANAPNREFLEGVDLADAEAFEEWLREMRQIQASDNGTVTKPLLHEAEFQVMGERLPEPVALTLSRPSLPRKPAIGLMAFRNLSGVATALSH